MPQGLEYQTIYINGKPYTARQLEPTLVSQWPAKVVTGDITKDSHPFLSSWNDIQHNTGGQGLYKRRPGDPTNMCWYSKGETRYANQFGRTPNRTIQTVTAGGTAADPVRGIQHNYNGNNRVYILDSESRVLVDDTSDGTGTWTSIRTLAADATDVVTFVPRTGGDSGKNMLFIAQGTDIDRTENGTAWNRDTTDAKFLAVWDDNLWRATAAGVFDKTADGTTWTGTLPNVPDCDGTYVYVTKLVVGPHKSGGKAIYATTNEALYQWDDEANVWLGPLLTWPRYEFAGIATIAARDEEDCLLIPVGLGVYQFIPGEPNTIRAVGLDRLDGVIAARDGYISGMVQTHQFMAVVISYVTGYSGSTEMVLYAWLGRTGGWHTLDWYSDSAPTGTTDSMCCVVSAYGSYRLYFSLKFEDHTIRWMNLYPGVHNPRHNPTQSFNASSGYLFTPWDSGAKESLSKVALSLTIRATGVSSTNKFFILYQTNLDENTSPMLTNTEFPDGLVDINGKHTFEFDANADGLNEGVEYDYIRFLILPGGGSSSGNPLLEYMELNYLQEIPPTWAHTFEVDLTGDFKQRSPGLMYDELKALAEPGTLVTLSWGPDATTAHTYMVRLHQMRGRNQQTGIDQRGKYILTFIEPIT